MKSTRNFFILPGILVMNLLMSCSEHERDSLIKMPDEFDVMEFSLDSIASDLFILPLKREIPLYRSPIINWYDSHYYYCVPSTGKIYKIDKEGTIVDVLDRKGRGKEEYLNIVDFFIDKLGNIYISTNIDKIIVYNNDFKFIYDIKYPVKRDGNMRVKWLNDNIHIFYFNYSGTGVSWICIDSTGKVLDSERSSEKYSPKAVSYPYQIFENNNKLYRFLFSNDTIYEVDSTGYHPFRLINRKFIDGYDLNHNYIIDHLGNVVPDKKRVIRSIHGLGDYWIINFQKLQGSTNYRLEETVLYDYINNRYFLIASDEANNRSVSIGPYIDWIGTGTFFPQNTIRILNNKFLISVLDSYKYLDLILNEDFERSIPQKPELKMRMKEIADTITIEDNPILFFLKLK